MPPLPRAQVRSSPHRYTAMISRPPLDLSPHCLTAGAWEPNQFWEWAVGHTPGGSWPVGEHFWNLDCEFCRKTVPLPVGRES